MTSPLQLVAPILAAAAILAALLQVDAVAVTARSREAIDLERGPILDRHGKLLAYSATQSGAVRRIYTLPDVSIPIGYRGSNGEWHGLERTYNPFLESQRVRHEWSAFFLHLRGRSIPGGRLRLTLDRHLQQVADRALGRYKGAVVALDPRSGAVLALVSKPYCPATALATASNLRHCRSDPADPLLDRATSLLVPPGSSFKIVTLSAALDTGRFSLSTTFSGADIFGPSPYFDNSTYPSNITRSDLTQLTLSQALAFSDNFTFAHIGLTLGAQTLLRYAHRYRIGRHIPFDYPVKRSMIANGRSDPDLRLVAQSSFGAEVDRVTPLQMALIAETVGNGGEMMAPHLAADRETAAGRVVWRYPIHSLARVMTGAAAHEVTRAMVFVVDHGSGWPAQIKGVTVAGKTGTAASGGSRPHAWFIAFAPAQHPIIAVAALRENAGEGFEFAAPVARKVLVAALQEAGYHLH